MSRTVAKPKEKMMKTIIAINAGQSGFAGGKTGKKKERYEMDKEQIAELTDQLTELIEELDEIREDLIEIEARLEESFDAGDMAEESEDDAEGSSLDRLQDICDAVDSAYQELNEAADGLAQLQ